jgi:hypothetical protein
MFSFNYLQAHCWKQSAIPKPNVFRKFTLDFS